jgi:hypothetical protein
VANGNGGLTQIRLPSGAPDLAEPLYLVRQNARNVDTGEDAATGIRWGRWSGGNVNIKSGGEEVGHLQLGDGGTHWIFAEGPKPELPSSGTREFTLAGATTPTDNHGQTGVLGNASLSADFTAQTVDASVELSMPATGTLWAAEALGLDINAPAATFGGEFDTVTITSQDGTGSVGAGSLSGFFSGDDQGALTGAGFGYSLSDGDDTTVSGTAAFGIQPEP